MRWFPLNIVLLTAVLFWLYMVLRFRYDAFAGTSNHRSRSIPWRDRAFFEPCFVSDWRALVGDDPPFRVLRSYNYNARATRILSYSLYGDNPVYFAKMRANIIAVPKVYPGWSVRVYLHDQSPQSLRRSLVDSGAQVFVVHDPMVRPGNAAGMFWRFLPLADPSLSVYVRDADDDVARYKGVVFDPLTPPQCYSGLWVGPYPKSYVRASCILKLAGCKLSFSESTVRNWPVRAPYGADEYFIATMAAVQPRLVRVGHFDLLSEIGINLARGLAGSCKVSK